MATLAPTCGKSIMMLFLQANNNFSTRLDVAGVAGDKRRSIIGFGDISAIPAGSTVSSAILTLTVNATDSSLSGANEFRCYPMTRFNWTESGTWNKYDGTNNWDSIGGADLGGGDYDTVNGITTGLLQPTTTGVKTYDIATTIQWILDHNPTTCDFLLKCANEALADPAYPVFDSRSDGATGPSMVITYLAPGGIGSAIYRYLLLDS